MVELEDCFVEERLQSNGFDFRAAAQTGENNYWSVEAVDEAGVASAPSEVWSFRVLDGADDTADGCECDQAGTQLPPFWYAAVGLLIAWRRRRTRVLN